MGKTLRVGSGKMMAAALDLRVSDCLGSQRRGADFVGSALYVAKGG